MKRRLDQELVERELAPSRSKAAALIMSGKVLVNDQPATKPGQQVTAETPITVKTPEHDFVSRGGLKLAQALDHFALNVADCVCLDSGASTGGFTDCLLQRGARKIYAVDVGRGQLAWKLQQDERVVMMDKTNLRHMTREQFDDVITVATLDLSFISLTKVFPALAKIAAPGALIVALIKPQFEVGRADVGKGGIVRDQAARERAIETVLAAGDELGWRTHEVIESPVTGADGNVEYLTYFVVS